MSEIGVVLLLSTLVGAAILVVIVLAEIYGRLGEILKSAERCRNWLECISTIIGKRGPLDVRIVDDLQCGPATRQDPLFVHIVGDDRAIQIPISTHNGDAHE